MNKTTERLRTNFKFFFDLVINEKVRTNVLSAIPFWVASIISGLVAVAYTKLFNLTEFCQQSILKREAWLIFLLAPVNFLIGWYLVKTFAKNARGSGIPQVMAAIDLPVRYEAKGVPKLLSLRIIIVKLLSSLFMVFGGGAIGREGPTIQISASIFRLVSKRIPASWPRLSEKSFILTGAAAGLAAAFNTPLGGVVFVIEELAKIHISLFRTALFTAVIVAGLTAQGILGPYLYLGYPDVQNLSGYIFVGVVAVAVLSGIAASLMSRMILKLLRWSRSLNSRETVVYIIIAGLIVASVAYFMNDGILGSGKNLMNRTLFTADKYVTWHTMLARIFGPVLSFSTGAAGGIFAPALSAGASVGAFLSKLFGLIGANANILILAGMVGFLTGVTRTPFTSAILVLEMTDRHSVIFHLMLAALIANLAAMLIDKHSFYEQLKKGYEDDVKNEIDLGQT